MKYIKIMKLGIKRVFAYRTGIILSLFSSVVSIFILQRFWLALYGAEQAQYLYMANYAIIAQVLGIIYQIRSPNTLSSRIRTGAISVELLRPWEYINALMFEDLGAIIGHLLSSGITLFATSKLLFDMRIPPIENMLLFVVSAFLGFLVLFLVKTIVAMACFWIIEASSLLILINVVIHLLSGQFLLAWLMPEWLEKIMNALPFIWIYQKPISIYIGEAGGAAEITIDYVQILLLQLGWIIFLYVLVLWIWRIAVDKLCVQGG
ncbi:MAG: ABC-2 family transporter protein [Lachnospiraceae bacterium]|nr:ABC-2 family transporter protein [Lachnospiraceae bacterium]